MKKLNLKYRKLYVSAAVVLLTSVFSQIALSHSLTQSYSWYFAPANNNVQPRVFDCAEFLDQYNTIYLGNPDKKIIYLTFDAGYENGNVAKILDVLKKHQAKAAFFILPHLMTANTDLVLRMMDEGHLVCNHSKTHHDLSKCTDLESFSAELLGAEKIFREATGREMSKYYRPPEGRFSEQNLQFADSLGYKTVFWSFAYADWDNGKQLPREKAISLILSRVHNGCVMLLHPTSNTNAEILDEVLTRLEEQGYTFRSLEEFEK